MLATLLLAQAGDVADGSADATSTEAGATGAEAGPPTDLTLERLDILHDPMPIFDYLSSLSIVWPAVMTVLGLLCILNGFRWHKPVVAVLAFFVGIWLGREFAAEMGRPAVVALALGLLFAIIAAPMMKVAVAIFAGLTGAFVGANCWTALEGSVDFMQPGNQWAGAAIGFVILAMLSLMMFRFVVVLFTSVGGAAMLVFGTIALLLQVDDFNETVSSSLASTQLLVPMLTLLAAVGGFIVQESRLRNEGIYIWSMDGGQADGKKKS